MANIKKSFNFRNGVQVDDDNLKVSATGLVGIGTTVPTEALDVRGNLVVSGVSSAATIQAGVLTVTTFNPTSIIGAGISVVSGVVTASSGIVTYYGDARFLQGLPTSQWEDVNTGFGVSSIYNTGGNVGIATSNPQFTLQVGGDVNSNKDGVGISSAGNIKISGIASASQFVGSFTGNVTGNVTGDVTGDVTGNSTGNLTGLVNSSGISTFGGINATGRIVGAATSSVIPFFYSNLSDLPSAVTYHGAFAHVHATGKGYYAHGGNWIELVNKDTSGNVSLSGDLDVDGHTNLDNVSVAGVTTFAGASTFSDDLVLGVGATVGIGSTVFFDNGVEARFGGGTIAPGLKISNDSTFSRITSANSTIITAVGSINIYGITNSTLQSNNNRLVTGGGTEIIETDATTAFLKHSGTEKLKTTDSGVYVSGIITATTELNSPLIGVGTDIPANDIQVRKSGNAEIQITSDTGIAGLTVGREAGNGNTNNAEFRYGGGAGSPYSSDQSLDIINYGLENFNYFLSGNNPGGAQGDFIWHKGINSDRLMTLTKDGNLGIGITLPTFKLQVIGVSTFSGDATFANNLTVGNNLTVNNVLNLPSGISANVTGNLTGNVTGLINSPVAGISTIPKLTTSGIGIGVTDNGLLVNISDDTSQKIVINNDSQVGIFTDTFATANIGVTINRNVHIRKAVSVGNTTRSAVDFSDVVNIQNEDETGLPFNRSQLAYMIPPRVTTTQRNLLRDAYTNSATLISGAMVYNTTSKRLEVYIDGGWVGLSTVA